MKYLLPVLILGSTLASHAMASDEVPAAATPVRKAAVESAPELPGAVDKLAAQIIASLPKGSASKIAVAPFVNLGPTAREKKLGEVVSELLVTRLSGKPNIQIIERAQLDAVLQELKLSMLGLTEGSNAEKVGKLLGAEAMIVGSVSEIGDKFAVTARHVNVTTGQVAFAKEVQVPQAGTIALSSKYIVTKSKGDAFFRSLLIPGWGQVYNDQDVKGYVFIGTTVALAGAGAFLYVRSKKVYDEDYMKATSKEKAADAYDNANNLRQNSTLVFIIAGGVWAVNAIDAVLSGTSKTEVDVGDEMAAVKTTIQPVVAERADGTRTAMLELKF